jgi:phage terminase large subunit-like protein
MTPDRATREAIRCPADERAAAGGCRFDEARGRFVVEWIERYCRLYEGDWAGQPLRLLDWQLDATLRLFGWVRRSEKWGREVRRFRAASIWVAKKNKKSPTLAAWGLYLLCGDGEQGQKIFLAAKDGTQARKIAGEHAVCMLQQSAELLAECRLNKSTYRITHLPTRSYLEPLSSSNARTQESKEGLNGSVLIDETHVVDRDFVRRISRAGISRSEPLQIEVSTAGNNPDGYGRERFDLARRVEKAEPGYEDDSLFVAIHAAPQELTDEDLDADPLRYGRLANPAMGHTVDPDEYLADYRQSRQKGITELTDFRMYRLNIWAKGSNPWLKEEDWQKCRREFTETDLEGRQCCAGLDLSRTRDMSALVLVFPWPEGGEECYRLLPFFWLPERRARELDHLAPMLAWARGGFLTLTPGDVIDYGFIRHAFRRLAERFRITELAYDPKFGEETTQALADGVMDAAGAVSEEGTGVERFAFAQTDENFGAPTADFERFVLSGNLHHNGHPVMSWQVSHAEVMIKVSKVKRIVKPKASGFRTVDGCVAAVMALARAGQAAAPVSVEVW